MDFAAISHGQVHSKLWLCEELEKLTIHPVNVAILGCWYGLTSFLMLSRNKNLYNCIDNIDIDQSSLDVARKINDAWIIFENKTNLICADVTQIDFNKYDLIISTSVEDIKDMSWYDKIPYGKMICLQSLNLKQDDVEKYENWKILNPSVTFDDFKKKIPLSTTLYEGTKEFDYGDLQYTRYMMIGIR